MLSVLILYPLYLRATGAGLANTEASSFGFVTDARGLETSDSSSEPFSVDKAKVCRNPLYYLQSLAFHNINLGDLLNLNN